MATPRDVIATYIEPAEPAPIEDLYRELSLHMQTSYLENGEELRKLIVFLQVASVALALEVALWTTAATLSP